MTKLNTLNISFLFAVTLSALICCKKNQQPEPSPQTEDRVLIGGDYYQITTIDNQIWTTLNYAGPGGREYDGNNNKPEYGRYYTFEEAQKITLPNGWRLPNIQDYITLARQQGVVITNYRATAQQAIRKLISTTNWRSVSGINSSGFNAYPGGYIYADEQPLDGDIAEFWAGDGSTVSIQENVDGKTLNLRFYKNSDSASYRFNVRFVREKY